MKHEQLNRELNHLRQQQYQPKYSSFPMLTTNLQLHPHVQPALSVANYMNVYDSMSPDIAPLQDMHESLTTSALPGMFKNTTSLNKYTSPHGGKVTLTAGSAEPLDEDSNQGTSMVFHGIISSYPVRHTGILPTTAEIPMPKTIPPPSTGLDHALSKKRGSRAPSNGSSWSIDERERLKQRKRMENCPKANNSIGNTRPIRPVKSTSANYPETDVGKLQQVNETWKQRYLALLRDMEEEEM